jgi:hypothetical protein
LTQASTAHVTFEVIHRIMTVKCDFEAGRSSAVLVSSRTRTEDGQERKLNAAKHSNTIMLTKVIFKYKVEIVSLIFLFRLASMFSHAHNQPSPRRAPGRGPELQKDWIPAKSLPE